MNTKHYTLSYWTRPFGNSRKDYLIVILRSAKHDEESFKGLDYYAFMDPSHCLG